MGNYSYGYDQEGICRTSDKKVESFRHERNPKSMNNKLSFLPFALVAIMLSSQLSFGQEYSVDELAQGFYAQYVEKSTTEDFELARMDVLRNSYKGVFLADWDKKYLYEATALHHAEGISLPPSVFVCAEERKDSASVFTLCWMGLRDSTDAANERLRSTLCKKYGHKRCGDAILIPARWFRGDLIIHTNPFLYGNAMLTNYMFRAHVERGELVQGENRDVFTSQFTMNGLNSDVSAIEMTRTDGYVNIRIDEKYNKERVKLDNYKAMTLLGRNVSRNAGSRFLPTGMQREFAVMLYLDEYDKAHLHPLLPRELTDADRILLAMLANLIDQQPAGIFTRCFSARGRFPAVFLKASLQNGQWFFKDYRFIE